MNRRVVTSKLGNTDKEYAYVADRLKLFREDCPNGLIETTPDIKDDGTIIFTARVLKDKAKPESGEATGHAMGKTGQAKAFEKLETQAVGRALALLGYLASGEIASSEEMQEFYDYQADKVSEAIALINSSESLDELKERFMSIGPLMAEQAIMDAKNAKKDEFAK